MTFDHEAHQKARQLEYLDKTVVALERIAVALEMLWHPSDILPINDASIDEPVKAIPYTLAETQEKLVAFCQENKEKVPAIQKWMQERAATSLKDLGEEERGELLDVIESF